MEFIYKKLHFQGKKTIKGLSIALTITAPGDSMGGLAINRFRELLL